MSAPDLDELQSTLDEFLEEEGPSILFEAFFRKESGGADPAEEEGEIGTPMSPIEPEEPWIRGVKLNKEDLKIELEVDLEYEGFKPMTMNIPESLSGSWKLTLDGEVFGEDEDGLEADDMKSALQALFAALQSKRDELLGVETAMGDGDAPWSPTGDELGSADGDEVAFDFGGDDDGDDDMFASPGEKNRGLLETLCKDFNQSHYVKKWYARFGTRGEDSEMVLHLLFPPGKTLGISKLVAGAWGIDLGRYIVVEIVFKNSLVIKGILEPKSILVFQTFEITDEIPENIAGQALEILPQDRVPFGFSWTVQQRIESQFFKKCDIDDQGKCEVGSGVMRSRKSFVQGLHEETLRIINSAPSCCLLCAGPLLFPGIKPTVCEKPVCVFGREKYSLGLSLESEIEKAPQICDLLFLMTSSATNSPMETEHTINRFNPFPDAISGYKMVEDHLGRKVPGKELKFLDDKDKPNNPLVRELFTKVPSIKQMQEWIEEGELKNELDGIDPRMYNLLRWTITSNMTHLHKLSDKKQLPAMKTPHQYLMLTGTGEKEQAFQALKRKHGSFLAWHGSNLLNWHCIMRIGLKNYSNTKAMTTGAVYGSGVYFSPNFSTSYGYSRVGSPPWQASAIGKNSVRMLALCEIIKQPGKKGYTASPHYVIPHEEHIQTRLFFVYTSDQKNPGQIKADSLNIPVVKWYD